MSTGLRLLFLTSLFSAAACAAAHVLTFANIAFYPIYLFLPLLFLVWIFAVEQINAREEIDDNIGEQKGCTHFHPPRDITENFRNQIFARYAAHMPDGENPDQEQQR
jgi:hypothetical protein